MLISRASGQGTLYRGSRPCRSSIKPFTPTSSAFQNYRIFRRPPFLRRNFRLKYERDGPGLDSYGFIEYLCEFQNFQIMHLKIEPKKVVDAYSTPIVQQTSFWSKVKELLGMDSRAFDFSVRNSEIYTNVGGVCTYAGRLHHILSIPEHRGLHRLFPLRSRDRAFGREPRPFSGRVVRIAAFVPSEALRGPAL